jgi:hypothetical protein
LRCKGGVKPPHSKGFAANYEDEVLLSAWFETHGCRRVDEKRFIHPFFVARKYAMLGMATFHFFESRCNKESHLQEYFLLV